MRHAPCVFVLSLAALPLVWGACAEPAAPPVAAPPKGSDSAAAGNGASLSLDDCSSLVTKTEAELAGAERNASACSADSDCEVVPGGSCLTASCGVAIAKSAAAAYQADFKRITGAACASWDAGRCATTLPIATPSCAQPKPICKAGRCDTAL